MCLGESKDKVGIGLASQSVFVEAKLSNSHFVISSFLLLVCVVVFGG